MLQIANLILHGATFRSRLPPAGLMGVAVFASLSLSGCGGDSAVGSAVGPTVKTPTVTDIQADRLSYRQITQFKVVGTALDSTITATARNCAGLVAVTSAAGSGAAGSTELSWRCTPTATGTSAVELQVKGTGVTVLKAVSFNVPDPQVTMVTSLGTLVVELNPTVVPTTVDNFLQYVRDGFYTNTLFHRVIGGFVAQGGWLVPASGPGGSVLSTATAAPGVQPGARAAVILESNKGLPNVRGTLAMARTAEANSATSQFYFNLVDNPALNYVSDTQPGYAVFGRVVQGLPVMDAIGGVTTATRFGLTDFPVGDVLVQTATQSK